MSYNTKQSSLIENLLKNTGGRHMTAEEITIKLASDGNAVGKSTVYRQLEKLTANGIVRRFSIEEGKGACYQYVGDDTDCHNHYHLKCIGCGRLLHVECDYLDKVAEHVLEHHGFVMDGERTVLYGMCGECRLKETETAVIK